MSMIKIYIVQVLMIIAVLSGCATDVSTEYLPKTGLEKGRVYRLKLPIFVTNGNLVHVPVNTMELEQINTGQVLAYSTVILPAGTRMRFLGSRSIPAWNTGRTVEHLAKIIDPPEGVSTIIDICGLIFHDITVPPEFRKDYIGEDDGSEQTPAGNRLKAWPEE